MKPVKLTLRSENGWEGSARNLQAWVDSVQNILAGNVRYGDQIGTVYQTTFNTSSPRVLRLSSSKPPIDVRCIRASTEANRTIFYSGVPLKCSWASTSTSSNLTILGGLGLDDNVDYDLTILVVEG